MAMSNLSLEFGPADYLHAYIPALWVPSEGDFPTRGGGGVVSSR